MKELLNDLKAENSKIIKEVYRKTYHSCKWIILNNQGTDTDAQDIFQQALFSLLEKIQQPESGISNIEGYLYRCCKYIWFKTRNDRGKTDLVESFPLETSFEEDIEIKELHESRLAEMYKGLDQLDPGCRQLLELTYFEDLSDKEIAPVMHYKLGFIRVKRGRCLGYLRKLVDQKFLES